MDSRLASLLEGNLDKYPKVLAERFPHIVDRIVQFWGTAELDRYFQSLMINDRPGRQGFPPEVGIELFRLSSLHGSLGLLKDRHRGAWDKAMESENTRSRMDDE